MYLEPEQSAQWRLPRLDLQGCELRCSLLHVYIRHPLATERHFRCCKTHLCIMYHMLTVPLFSNHRTQQQNFPGGHLGNRPDACDDHCSTFLPCTCRGAGGQNECKVCYSFRSTLRGSGTHRPIKDLLCQTGACSRALTRAQWLHHPRTQHGTARLSFMEYNLRFVDVSAPCAG